MDDRAAAAPATATEDHEPAAASVAAEGRCSGGARGDAAVAAPARARAAGQPGGAVGAADLHGEARLDRGRRGQGAGEAGAGYRRNRS